jgi:hypothetical protein
LIGDQTSPKGLLDKSKKPYWNPVKRPDISDVQNRTVQFAKPDTLVLTGHRNTGYSKNRYDYEGNLDNLKR